MRRIRHAAVSIGASFSIFLGLSQVEPVQAAWRVSGIANDRDISILSVTQVPDPWTQEFRDRGQTQLRNIPLYLSEDDGPSREFYVETLLSDQELARAGIDPFVQSSTHFQAWPGSEVRTLIEQGPVANRIDLTIVGDGYTLDEKDRFFEDAERLTRDLFGQSTFFSYLPLFNVHAVFVPSRESGISDLVSKDTALKLTREPKGSKRAIMVGRVDQAERAIALAPGSDFPILVANDDFYGGLGGRYAITTRSPQTGSMVLRHELGHNFGEVGEEYDGGMAYWGANHSRGRNLPWKHWLTETDPHGAPRIFETQALTGDYVWKNLASGPYRASFVFPSPTTSGPFTISSLISTVGWSTPEDVHVFLDGQRVGIQGVYTNDRSFFSLALNQTLAPGPHRLEIRENILDGDNVLAFARLYAHPAGYEFKPDLIGGFATFNQHGTHVGYRPTHESCLMREMRLENFCSVDLENMWHRFLGRVSLIDELALNSNSASVELKTPSLAGLDIRWFTVNREGTEAELTDHAGKTVIPMPQEARSVTVRVRFRTPEVRRYDSKFEAERSIALP